MGNIPIGRIAGFAVSVNWSVLVILWLFTWSLASTLPAAVPGYSKGAYWLAGEDNVFRPCSGREITTGPALASVPRCQPVVGLVRNTRRNLPIWISSPLDSTSDCTDLRLR